MGTVVDRSGAVLPGATVVARELATGVETRTTTNGAGAYSIPFLPIGSYQVMITAAGFAPQLTPAVTLDLDKTVKVNAQLKVGQATATVEVSAAAGELLNTSDASLGIVLSNGELESIPLNGQNFATATMYQPGAINTAPSTGSSGGNAIERVTSNTDQSSANGNRTQDNNYLVDGIPINQLYNNLVGFNPAPESIEQMKVISSNAPAEFGNANGGEVVVELKSGTNHIHGSAYEFLENQNLEANSWSNKHQTPVIAINPFTMSMFGGTVGGPIVPNRLFFFADYEGVRQHSAGQGTASLFTQAMRSGDFSALLSAPTPVQLYDTQNNFAPYKDNQISIVNPVAKYLFAHPELYPLPNATPLDGVTENNYQGPSSGYTVNNQWDLKIEWDPRSADRITGFYTDSQPHDGSNPLLLIYFPSANKYPTHIFGLSWAHTFSNAVVNNAHAGFSRVNWVNSIPTDPSGQFGYTGNQQVGIPLPFAQQYVGFSNQNISGNYTGGGTAANLQDLLDNQLYYDENVKWQRGNHLLSAGLQALRYQENLYTAEQYGFLGSMIYSGQFTSNPGVQSDGEGSGGADFVLDRVATAQLAENGGLTGTRQWRISGYVQDDWRITRSLTINLGARYELDQPWYEVHNKMANLVLTGAGRGLIEYSETVPEGAPAGSIVCPTRACYNTNYDQAMPRLGFAWQARPNFVVRAGYGATSFSEGNLARIGVEPYQLAYYKTSLAPTATNGGQPYSVEGGFLSSAGSDFFSQNASLAPLTADAPPQYIQDWNLTVGYEPGANTSVSVGYVGETGSHLRMYMNANQLTSPTATAPFASLVGQGGKLEETLMEGMMDYHALQATVRQRLSRGFTGTLNYTWSRAMTTSSGFYGTPNISGQNGAAQNGYDAKADYGPAGQDIRNAVNALGNYALPVGHGRLFLGSANRVSDAILGGWQISASAILYSGFPITINGPSEDQMNSYGQQRANYYRPLVIRSRTINNWWGTDPSATPCQQPGEDNGACAYGSEGVGEFGTARVNSERGPGFRQVDASLYKSFHTVREQQLSFRADLFNLFNIADYSNPDNGVTDTTWGQITGTISQSRTMQLSLKYQF